MNGRGVATAMRAGGAFAIKADIGDTEAGEFSFVAQKTMYGGKLIAEGDKLFLFASENQGGQGLFALGIVTAVETVAKSTLVRRQTPRMTVIARRSATARNPLGRSELKPFDHWDDERPQTELNFKLYRQATNKIVGVTAAAAAFLETRF